jgi:pimeloyl-ACP methyl ester carboxylesterase
MLGPEFSCGFSHAIWAATMHSDGLRFTWFLRWALLAALCFPLDARGEDKEEPIPEAETVLLKTKDGLQLHATFYPARTMNKNGTEVPKKVRAAVILLHGYKGERQDFDELALRLQATGHAVIAPDLRGHGESLEIALADGGTEKIKADSIRATDLGDMVKFDLEAVKSYLLGKNNEGELNIDKLCVVGADMGAIVAVEWALLDWTGFQALTTGKQGQDVKALVLISPEANFKGVKITEAMNNASVRSQLAILLIAGRKGGKYADEVNKLYKHFSRYHLEKSDPPVVRLLCEAKLQGGALLGEKSLGVEEAIVKFVNTMAERPFPWAERRSAFE